MPPKAEFIEEHVLRVGTVDFYCAAFTPGSMPDGCLPVLKHPDNVERCVELAQAVDAHVLVELGIDRGGSTALLNELFTPDTLVALEINVEPARVLTEYIATRATNGVVQPHYGVDQADRATVSRIIDDATGDRPIDVLIDDASHLYVETRSSFETLFPRVRPGGLFIIEDWNADQLLGDAVGQARNDPSSPLYERVRELDAKVATGEETRPVPLTQLVMELTLVRASAGDAIREMTINENWVIVERGEEGLDAETFRLDELVHDHHFGLTSN